MIARRRGTASSSLPPRSCRTSPSTWGMLTPKLALARSLAKLHLIVGRHAPPLQHLTDLRELTLESDSARPGASLRPPSDAFESAHSHHAVPRSSARVPAFSPCRPGARPKSKSNYIELPDQQGVHSSLKSFALLSVTAYNLQCVGADDGPHILQLRCSRFPIHWAELELRNLKHLKTLTIFMMYRPQGVEEVRELSDPALDLLEGLTTLEHLEFSSSTRVPDLKGLRSLKSLYSRRAMGTLPSIRNFENLISLWSRATDCAFRSRICLC